MTPKPSSMLLKSARLHDRRQSELLASEYGNVSKHEMIELVITHKLQYFQK